MNKPKTKPVLQAEAITKNFGGLQALSSIDFHLEKQEILGLIGPNGAGKSTLFNVITSIYSPDSGDLFLEGERITGLKPHDICKMGISRTFQLVRTFLSMTAIENVLVGAIFGQGQRGKAARKSAIEALELVGLQDKKNIITSHMTLSDRRLLEIARAIASRPLLSLFDEPLAGLNPSETIKMLEIIARARDEKKISIIWVEHKVDAIFQLCDRVIVLDYGRKIAEGMPEEISMNQEVIEAYLGKSFAEN